MSQLFSRSEVFSWFIVTWSKDYSEGKLQSCLMAGSCHLDRTSNIKICVECQIFLIVIYVNWHRVLQFGAHSSYYKGALTLKRSFLVVCTHFRSDFHVGWKNQNKHSTLNSSFNDLEKWQTTRTIKKFSNPFLWTKLP